MRWIDRAVDRMSIRTLLLVWIALVLAAAAGVGYAVYPAKRYGLLHEPVASIEWRD